MPNQATLHGVLATIRDLLILFLPVLTSLAAVAVYVLFGGTAPQFPLLKKNQHNSTSGHLFS